MLHDGMQKDEYLLKGSKIARKILRIKRSKEFDGERLYILQGLYGEETSPMSLQDLEASGYNKCVTLEELNKMLRDGEFVPSEMTLCKGKKCKRKKS